MTAEDISNNSVFGEPQGVDPKKVQIIKVIGVGGGGGNAVGYMYRQGVNGVKFVVANTDQQALNASPVPDRVLLGHTGLGAGDKPEVGREAAEESIDTINGIFERDIKMVFITAGMGGGTGTGAAPVVARVAREHGVLTIGIVTIPFMFEGRPKIRKALEGAEEMRKYVDALLLINNERLIEIYPDLDFESAFDKADDTLATAARSISDLITNNDTKMNIDFNDVDTTLRNGGSAIISLGYGEGENRVMDAIQSALKSPLLRNSNILGAKRLLFDLAYSRQAQHRFGMGEMAAFTDFVNSIEEVAVIPGVSYDESLGDKVKVTILASGFDIEELLPAEPMSKPKPGKNPEPVNTTAPDDKIDKLYGTKRKNYVVLTPDQLDDDEIIEGLEQHATATRDKNALDLLNGKRPASPAATPNPTPATTPSTTPDEANPIVF